MSICPNAMNDGRPGLDTARITIDLSAIATNWRQLRDLSPGAETGAVVKADAYGMGAVPIATALRETGCRTFFVVFPQEGITLRSALPDARILVFAGLTSEAAPAFIAHSLTPMLNSGAELRAWKAACATVGRALPCGLNFDTGMNRLGLQSEQAAGIAADLEGIEVVLVSSHLACADDPDHRMNRQQLAAFTDIVAHFPGVRRSLANSPGILLGSEFHFDLTRPGIALHGGEANSAGNNPMRPVAAFEARILQIRSAQKGETVGYGAVHTLARDSTLAICAAGYADGIRRSMSVGHSLGSSQAAPRVWIAGLHAPIVGRVSMDLVAIDITDLPGSAVSQGDWVEFFGGNVPLEEFARSSGTIGYEALTGIGSRVTRRYICADTAIEGNTT
jgi:alanine racemase